MEAMKKKELEEEKEEEEVSTLYMKKENQKVS